MQFPQSQCCNNSYLPPYNGSYGGCGNQYPIVPGSNPALQTWNGQAFVVADGSAQNRISLPFLQVNNGAATYVVGADNNGVWSYYSPNLSPALAGGAAGQVPWQISTNVTGFTATGVNGQLLQSGGTGSPTWLSQGLSTQLLQSNGNSSSATWIAPNNLLVTATGSTTARTLANRFTDVVNVKDFGAVGNAGISGTGIGVVDDAPAFQAANDYLASRGGGIITYAEGRYYIGTAITLSRNVSIQGPTGRADCGNPFGNTSAYFNSLQTVPALILNPAISTSAPTGAITISSGGGMQNVYMFRKGLNLDGTDLPTNYAGTAIAAFLQLSPITILTDSLYITGCSILGFSYAIYKQFSSRSRIEDTLIDCNNGIVDNGSGDINRYNDVHCYGVLQANATGHDSFSDRSGNAFFFGVSTNGGPTLNGCFAYSYQVGMYFDVAGSYTINDCWIDGTTDAVNFNPLVDSRVGILYGNTIQNAEIQISNTRICCQGTGIFLKDNNYGVIAMQNIIMWHNNVGINCSSTYLTATNLTIRSYRDIGIVFNSKAAADTAKIANLLMYDRKSGAIDFNAGGGNPDLTQVSYIGGSINIVNFFAENYTPVSGNVTFLNGNTFAYLYGSGQITSISPKWDGLVVSLQFYAAGSTFASSDFRISGGSFTAQAGSSISLRYNNSDSKWYEVCRAL